MSFVDVKYIGIISSRLDKFAQKSSHNYEFRCPYCGDSKKSKNKRRGYFYQIKNDFNFKCHNCGKSNSFSNFLKDLDPTLYDQYILEKFRKKTHNLKEPEKLKFNTAPVVFKKKSLNLQTIAELNTEHPARAYLEKRQIPEKFLRELYYCEKFKEWTNTQKQTFNSVQYDEPRIIIPLIKDGEIFGYQGRSLSKSSKVKYITIILDEHQPKVFGWDTIDWNRTVYIVEGPFDSMFLNNAIAMVGADMDYMFFIQNYDVEFVFVYDNEKRNKEMIARVEKTIDMKFPVVIWLRLEI